MKIAIDAGALCAPPERRFGNYWVSRDLIDSLLQQEHDIRLYGFQSLPDDTKDDIVDHFRFLRPSLCWNQIRIPLEQLVHPTDYYFAMNQAIPTYTSGNVIAFSHGLAAHFHKDLYPEAYNKLEKQIKNMVERSTMIVVSSQKVAEEFHQIHPNVSLSIIPFGVPKDMMGSIKREKSENPYFLFVGMDHPVKRIEYLISAFQRVRKETTSASLVLVGPHVRWKEVPGVTVIENCGRSELRGIYQKARALITASSYESFNLPVLEALANGCPVIGLKSAIIPEFEEYVSCADSDEEFEDELNTCFVGSGRKVPDKVVNEIRTAFTWENYVKKLLPSITSSNHF